MEILTEVRYVAKEIGGYEETMRLQTEVRRWWIDAMQREAEAKASQIEEIRSGKKTKNV